MSNGENVLVQATGLCKVYHDGTRELEVLRDAELQVRKGEITSIVGASGAGKSTLLHLLGALDKPNKGAIVRALPQVTQMIRKVSGSVGFCV